MQAMAAVPGIEIIHDLFRLFSICSASRGVLPILASPINPKLHTMTVPSMAILMAESIFSEAVPGGIIIRIWLKEIAFTWGA